MKWLVCINSEGKQCQIPAGKGDLKKAAEEEKALNKQAKIRFIFEFGEGGQDPDKDYQNRETFKHFKNVLKQRLYKKYGAADPSEYFGYSLRKAYAMGDGIEVLADLDADDFDEFKKKYSGAKGAAKILWSTEKIMSGSYDRNEPAKTISKMIRKLEIEAEDE